MADNYQRFRNEKEKLFRKEGKRFLSLEEELALFDRIKKGDEMARHELVQMHLGFLDSIANEYGRTPEQKADLLTVGALALYKRIDSHDTTLGYKFYSYAVHQIRADMTAYFRDEKHKGFTGRNYALQQNMKKFINNHILENGYSPVLQDAINQFPNESVSEQRLERAFGLAMNGHTTSLDHAPDEQTPLSQRLEDHDAAFDKDYLRRQAIAQALSTLPKRERTIFYRREVDNETFVDIASSLSLSPTKVIQLHGVARRKLQLYMKSRPQLQKELINY